MFNRTKRVMHSSIAFQTEAWSAQTTICKKYNAVRSVNCATDVSESFRATGGGTDGECSLSDCQTPIDRPIKQTIKHVRFESISRQIPALSTSNMKRLAMRRLTVSIAALDAMPFAANFERDNQTNVINIYTQHLLIQLLHIRRTPPHRTIHIKSYCLSMSRYKK